MRPPVPLHARPDASSSRTSSRSGCCRASCAGVRLLVGPGARARAARRRRVRQARRACRCCRTGCATCRRARPRRPGLQAAPGRRAPVARRPADLAVPSAAPGWHDGLAAAALPVPPRRARRPAAERARHRRRSPRAGGVSAARSAHEAQGSPRVTRGGRGASTHRRWPYERADARRLHERDRTSRIRDGISHACVGRQPGQAAGGTRGASGRRPPADARMGPAECRAPGGPRAARAARPRSRRARRSASPRRPSGSSSCSLTWPGWSCG